MRFTGLGVVLWCWVSLPLVLTPTLVRASPGPSAEIRVSLFGQPCVLQGPVDERTLKLIHALSPEQIYPKVDSPLTSDPTRKALGKLRAATGTPIGLDRYRDRLSKRLEAQLAFLEAVEGFRKDHKIAPILEVSKSLLTGRRQKEFEAALKKAETAKTLTNRDGFEALFDSFSDGIEADPEEEFHRAIQRLNVQYTCSFGENDHASD